MHTWRSKRSLTNRSHQSAAFSRQSSVVGWHSKIFTSLTIFWQLLIAYCLLPIVICLMFLYKYNFIPVSLIDSIIKFYQFFIITGRKATAVMLIATVIYNFIAG